MGTSLLSALGRGWWVLLIYGLVAVLFGVLAVGWPLAAAQGLVWALGIMALVEGVISLLGLFGREGSVPKGWLLLYALASLVFGVVAVTRPLAVASVLALLLGAWLVFAGIYRIVIAIRIRRHVKGEWLLVLSGVLALLLGVLFVASPLAGAAAATLWVGVGSLVYGVLQVVVAFKLRRLR